MSAAQTFMVGMLGLAIVVQLGFIGIMLALIYRAIAA